MIVLSQTTTIETPPPPENASLSTKAIRLVKEVGAWVSGGAVMVPTDVHAARLSACQACSYYAANGNAGFGECRHPGCGCTRAKLLLATSTCPKNPPEWGPYHANVPDQKLPAD